MRFFENRSAQPSELRAIDRALGRWVHMKGGGDALADVAPWVSYADGNADAALPLFANERYTVKVNADALARDPLVGDGSDLTPFVLDHDLLYLHRNYAAETFCADKLNERRALAKPASFEPTIPDGVDPLQAEAIRNVMGKNLFILTGGPGTGKTTTVKHMLHALQHDAPKNIVIAAPTGKAAQRLSESLGAAFGADPLTVHRFLNTETTTADILVIDEASMLDLWMLHSVLDAIRDDAVLILVGDANQLNSVGTGSVFADIVTAFDLTPRNDCIVLERSFRANQTVNALNHAVLHNEPSKLASIVHADEPGELITGWTQSLLDELVGPLQGLAATDDNARAAFGNASKRQLLTALRHDRLGSLNVAKQIEQSLKRSLHLDSAASAFQGQLLMVTGNDYTLKLFNGDVGMVFGSAADGFKVAFETSDGGIRWYAREALNQVESAFAMTIHKSQGSEYSAVALLLPSDPESMILSRQLIYTGVSRARDSAAIWGSDDVLREALGQQAFRFGGLKQRLLQGSP